MSLGDEIFVLRWKERDQLEVCDVISYRLQRRLTVPDAQDFTDLTSCDHYQCLYKCTSAIIAPSAFIGSTQWVPPPHGGPLTTSPQVSR